MNFLPENEEEERRVRRAERIAEMKRQKEQQRKRRMMIKKAVPFVFGGVCVLVIALVAGSFMRESLQNTAEAKSQVESSADGSVVAESESAAGGSIVAESESTAGGSVVAENESAAGGSSAEKTEAADISGVGVHGAVMEGVSAINRKNAETAEGDEAAVAAQASEVATPYSAKVTENTAQLGGNIVSSNAVLIDLSTDTILARKAENERISPASMTKVLTVLVAAEHVTDLDDTFTITIDITDYSYVNDCSNVGFAKDETVTIRDLFYGTILPSGADAAVGLATYVAGSQEEFVKLMNEKLDELGISDTAHFTNCVGLYDEDHYCTVYDMAVIMKAAIDNDLCREVMSAHTYTTSVTPEHPEGITISNWFLRRIEDKDSGGEVLCGKTGYVVQSGNCATSYGISETGKGYICVTANATSGWKCIYDHVDIYKKYMESNEEVEVETSENTAENS